MWPSGPARPAGEPTAHALLRFSLQFVLFMDLCEGVSQLCRMAVFSLFRHPRPKLLPL